jgi:hypothetical protein
MLVAPLVGGVARRWAMAAQSVTKVSERRETESMAHYFEDGTIVVAKLKRKLIGGAVYTDVTVRREDGSHRNIGTIMALEGMWPAMVPGTRGRFYFHDVLGSKGIHGVRPVGGQAHFYFPYRWDLMTIGMGSLNLLMALGWWLLAGSFAPFATALGLLCLTLGGLFIRTRIGATREYRADDPHARSSSELRSADAHA